MNRKYIVICSFFVAFFVLSLLCYGSFEYAKKQEQKELAQQMQLRQAPSRSSGLQARQN